MHNSESKGLFIGLIGVPGVGKSTLANALANKLQAEVFIEPGEEHWPVDATLWQQHVNEIESWVCNTNSQYFREARKIANAGKNAVADAGIFLVNSILVDDPACDYWYGYLNKEQKQKFYEQGLNHWSNAEFHPDILVHIETDKATWLKFLEIRGRGYDSDDKNIKTYDAQKSCMLVAARKFAQEQGIRFINFNNELANPDVNVARLLAQLEI